MDVLTSTSRSIPSETSTTSAVEATGGVGTVSILVTVVSAQATLIDICRHIVDMCTYMCTEETQYLHRNQYVLKEVLTARFAQTRIHTHTRTHACTHTHTHARTQCTHTRT